MLDSSPLKPNKVQNVQNVKVELGLLEKLVNDASSPSEPGSATSFKPQNAELEIEEAESKLKLSF
jgi:hypothetical protein